MACFGLFLTSELVIFDAFLEIMLKRVDFRKVGRKSSKTRYERTLFEDTPGHRESTRKQLFSGSVSF